MPCSSSTIRMDQSGQPSRVLSGPEGESDVSTGTDSTDVAYENSGVLAQTPRGCGMLKAVDTRICVRQLVASRCDKLTRAVADLRHGHAGNPDVSLRSGRSIVSVLAARGGLACAGRFMHISTFGLWHASGYQKCSKL